jgi:hypothetical protein
MWLHSFQGIFALPQKAQLCNPCLRYELSPFSQEGHQEHATAALAGLSLRFDMLPYAVRAFLPSVPTLQPALELGQILPYIQRGNVGAGMPEIARLGGFKLLMFFQDENSAACAH